MFIDIKTFIFYNWLSWFLFFAFLLFAASLAGSVVHGFRRKNRWVLSMDAKPDGCVVAGPGGRRRMGGKSGLFDVGLSPRPGWP